MTYIYNTLSETLLTLKYTKSMLTSRNVLVSGEIKRIPAVYEPTRISDHII